jgi:hypothetical protein
MSRRPAAPFTRCYPRSFTFYLADPSARLTTIALAVRVNRLYLAHEFPTYFLYAGTFRQFRREESFLFFLVQGTNQRGQRLWEKFRTFSENS